MSVYAETAESLRDTTKWLTAFVPVAAIVGSATAIGRGTLRDLSDGQRGLERMWQNGDVLAGLILTTAGVGLILIFGGRVLSAQPKDLATVLASDSDLAAAFNNGVGFPYFLNAPGFQAKINDLHSRWSEGGSVSEADYARSVAASELLREWSLYVVVARLFRAFVVALISATVAIVVGVYCMANGPAASAEAEAAPAVLRSIDLRGAIDLD